MDSGKSFLHVLLDLTAAFDTVDHKILITSGEEWVGITASALQWFRPYFSDRSFCVMMDDFLLLLLTSTQRLIMLITIITYI